MTQPPPPPQPYGQQPYGQQPYGQPYGQPSPYGQPPKQSNKTLWIVLGVIGGVLLLCCGGGVVVLGIFANEVDNQIDEEREHDTPRQVAVGEEFEHDDFVAESGWAVVRDDLGDFDITGLTLTNESDDTRTAYLEFSVYRDDTILGDISCTSESLGPDETSVVDCYSVDEFMGDFDEVRVADSF